MKIRSVDVPTLNIDAPPPRNTCYPHTSYVVARVQTEEGLEGLGSSKREI